MIPMIQVAEITMRVGNLGTFPVFMYSIMMGMKNPSPRRIDIPPSHPKNLMGLRSRRRAKIVFITLKPSEKVFSLELDPS